MKKLSIIVPVYNVENYLEACVQSLLNQDIPHEEYEIIMINDGSTDKSLDVAEDLLNKHPSLILINQENQGLSGARNTGMAHAQGEYIMFVDSDDELFPNVLGSLISIVYENKLEVCAYRMKYCDSHNHWHKGSVQPFLPAKIYSGEYAILHGADIGSACIYLYKAAFLNKHSLVFTRGIYHEDVDFNLRMYALATKMMFSDVVIYKYNYNPKSIQRELSREKMLKSLESEVQISKHIHDFIHNQSFSDDLINFYETHFNSVLVSVLLQMLGNNPLLREDKLKLLNEMRQKSLYPIKGRTLSNKTTFIKSLLNISFIYKLLL